MSDVIEKIKQWQLDIGSKIAPDSDMAAKHIGFVLEECAESLEAIEPTLPEDTLAEKVAQIAHAFKSYGSVGQTYTPEQFEALADAFADMAVFAIAGLMRCGRDYPLEIRDASIGKVTRCSMIEVKPIYWYKLAPLGDRIVTRIDPRGQPNEKEFSPLYDQSTIDSLQARIAELEKGVAAVEALIDESEGVAGLHRNGDIAPWDELRSGGRFEGWLFDFDAAIAKENSNG